MGINLHGKNLLQSIDYSVELSWISGRIQSFTSTLKANSSSSGTRHGFYFSRENTRVLNPEYNSFPRMTFQHIVGCLNEFIGALHLKQTRRSQRAQNIPEKRGLVRVSTDSPSNAKAGLRDVGVPVIAPRTEFPQWSVRR